MWQDHVTSSGTWFVIPPIVTESVSQAILAIMGSKHISVTTLTSQDHVTSSITWPFDSISYWWSIGTEPLSLTVLNRDIRHRKLARTNRRREWFYIIVGQTMLINTLAESYLCISASPDSAAEHATASKSLKYSSLPTGHILFNLWLWRQYYWSYKHDRRFVTFQSWTAD